MEVLDSPLAGLESNARMLRRTAALPMLLVVSHSTLGEFESIDVSMARPGCWEMMHGNTGPFRALPPQE